jgi:hypothetical protein
MNCQELNAVLDTHAPEQLGSAHKRGIEQHFASCQACREAWAAYSEVVAAPIPEAPRDLHRRIATALEEQEASDAGRVRRSIIIGSVLVFGAALAAPLTLGLAQRERICPRA